jgi:hypothetical protein
VSEQIPASMYAAIHMAMQIPPICVPASRVSHESQQCALASQQPVPLALAMPARRRAQSDPYGGSTLPKVPCAPRCPWSKVGCYGPRRCGATTPYSKVTWVFSLTTLTPRTHR